MQCKIQSAHINYTLHLSRIPHRATGYPRGCIFLIFKMSSSESSSDDDFQEFLTVLIQLDELDHEGERLERTPSHGGSRVGKRGNIERNHVQAHARLMQDYFLEHSTYTAEQFRRRFRMSKSVYFRVYEALRAYDKYFTLRKNAVGRLGLSGHQKITAALRMLAYGISADSLDESFRLAESTALECLQNFCDGVVHLFAATYLRNPTEADLRRILTHNARRGFPGMVGSVDCMHWTWKNCPKAWHGMYQGRNHKPTVVLEAVATHDLWIWHAFFGMPGSNNDLNVLDRSDLFEGFINGRSSSVEYSVNGRIYNTPYYLADGIYPNWAGFVKTISNPVDNKQKLFAKVQEAVRKDVERAFGVLQARFRILDTPCRLWNANSMRSIILCSIILHNMVVEDERDTYSSNEYLFEGNAPQPEVRPALALPMHWNEQRFNIRRLRCGERSSQLQEDLIEHLWQMKGDEVEEDV